MPCGCNSYGGFFDELKEIFTVAAPVVGGIQGATTGFEQGGFLDGISGAITGVSKGIIATQPQVIYQQTIPTRPTITGTGSPTFYSDSLLGTGQAMTQAYPNATYVIPAPAATDNTKLYVVAGLGFAALLGILLFRKL